ncbi:MAG TPA: type II toxin-antitoxin system HicA family toxin [Pseudomonas sp.]
MNSRELISRIEADGWYLVRVNGSHHHFRHPTKSGLVTIPHPRKDLLAKTAASILKQAGLK